jgi:hypothetical protein
MRREVMDIFAWTGAVMLIAALAVILTAAWKLSAPD